MKAAIPTNKLKFEMQVILSASEGTRLRVVTFDGYKPNTKYSDRFINFSGTTLRKINLMYGASPETMGLQIYNTSKGEQGSNDDSFIIKDLKIKKLKTNDVWMDKDSREFVKFALDFCENAGIKSTGVYQSDTGKFTINYLNNIVDKGVTLSTPARVGHLSGIIEVSKGHFMGYTVPQRFIILLHEFSHKYRNPKIGKPISDEIAADINALYIYLGMGFPRIEAREVYAKVFQTAPNAQNLQRNRIISDFIDKYDAGKLSITVQK